MYLEIIGKESSLFAGEAAVFDYDDGMFSFSDVDGNQHFINPAYVVHVIKSGPSVGPASGNRKKLSAREADQMRELYRRGMSVSELAESFDIHRSNAWRIVNNHYYRR